MTYLDFAAVALGAIADLAILAAIGLALAAAVASMAHPGRQQAELDARRIRNRRAAVTSRAKSPRSRRLNLAGSRHEGADLAVRNIRQALAR